MAPERRGVCGRRKSGKEAKRGPESASDGKDRAFCCLAGAEEIGRIRGVSTGHTHVQRTHAGVDYGIPESGVEECGDHEQADASYHHREKLEFTSHCKRSRHCGVFPGIVTKARPERSSDSRAAN